MSNEECGFTPPCLLRFHLFRACLAKDMAQSSGFHVAVDFFNFIWGKSGFAALIVHTVPPFCEWIFDRPVPSRIRDLADSLGFWALQREDERQGWGAIMNLRLFCFQESSGTLSHTRWRIGGMTTITTFTRLSDFAFPKFYDRARTTLCVSQGNRGFAARRVSSPRGGGVHPSRCRTHAGPGSDKTCNSPSPPLALTQGHLPERV